MKKSMKLLEEARDLISTVEYPLEFNPAEWRECIDDTTCYDYALGIKSTTPHMIGDFIGKRVTKKTRFETQFQILVEELEELGFDVITCSTDDAIPEDEGALKIYVEWNDKDEYHFLRQDFDRGWSHKAVGFLPTRVDEEGFIIKDPETDCFGRNGRCILLTRIM